jgi:isocitrate dehydrogenase
MELQQMAQSITVDKDGRLQVPDQVTIPFIEGDGVGPDIWRAAVKVFDASVSAAFGDKRKVHWHEVLAGEKAFEQTRKWLPVETLEDFTKYKVGIKGPLSTPVGGGFRSLNVTIRHELDLYACIRPVTYIAGMPSPMKEPHKVDMIVFRENTEDVYAGIEWPAGSEDAKKLAGFLNNEMGQKIDSQAALGIKPMSEFGSKRLIKRAIRWALEKNRGSVTLVHKGNIMKYTEGAFKDWGYQLASEEFGAQTVAEADLADGGTLDKVVMKDRIADAMFQQVLLRPEEYEVLAMPNLNGDYLSDALAAQVGGLGMAPGGNFGDEVAVFEATHGTAPKYAGKDMINPGSVILSGAFMFDHLGWDQAADLIRNALARAIEDKIVTYDLARQMPGATKVACSEFGQAVVDRMGI